MQTPSNYTDPVRWLLFHGDAHRLRGLPRFFPDDSLVGVRPEEYAQSLLEELERCRRAHRDTSHVVTEAAAFRQWVESFRRQSAFELPEPRLSVSHSHRARAAAQLSRERSPRPAASTDFRVTSQRFLVLFWLCLSYAGTVASLQLDFKDASRAAAHAAMITILIGVAMFVIYLRNEGVPPARRGPFRQSHRDLNGANPTANALYDRWLDG